MEGHWDQGPRLHVPPVEGGVPACLTSSHVAGPRGTDKSSLFSAQGVLDPPGEAPCTQEEQGWSEGMRCSLTGKAHSPCSRPSGPGVARCCELVVWCWWEVFPRWR